MSDLVSVLLSCYNYGDYLEEALQSVLNQSYDNIEIILVDDGSDDERTLEIIEKYKSQTVFIRHDERSGNPSKAVNEALKIFKGKYFMHMGGDDLLDKGAIKVLVASIGDVDYVYGDLVLIDGEGKRIGKWQYTQYDNEEIIRYTYLRNGSAVIPMVGLFKGDFIRDKTWGGTERAEDAYTAVQFSRQGWTHKSIDYEFCYARRYKGNVVQKDLALRDKAVWEIAQDTLKNNDIQLSYLFFCEDDWANLGCLFAKALRTQGVIARSITKNPHVFKYPEQSIFCMTGDELYVYMGSADVIVFMHTPSVPRLDYSNKKLFVFHGGTRYRLRSEGSNALYNKMVYGTISQHYEFLSLGAKNNHWLLPPIDVDLLQPDFTYHNKTFAHYPRHPDVNGSEVILRLMKDLDCPISFDSNVDWVDNLKRIGECDIYIEQFAPHDWGLTALEAAALGKVVITTFRGLEHYEKEYGKCELIVANDYKTLEKQVKKVMAMSETEILAKKRATRIWVENLHSLESVGKRLRGILDG